jgi:hypothetical protein
LSSISAGCGRGVKVCGRIGAGRGADRATLGGPLLEAAIEHRGREAHDVQHPPDARRPHDAIAAVEHHAGAVADAVPAHDLGEAFGRQHHEVHGCVLP